MTGGGGQWEDKGIGGERGGSGGMGGWAGGCERDKEGRQIALCLHVHLHVHVKGGWVGDWSLIQLWWVHETCVNGR